MERKKRERDRKTHVQRVRQTKNEGKRKREICKLQASILHVSKKDRLNGEKKKERESEEDTATKSQTDKEKKKEREKYTDI